MMLTQPYRPVAYRNEQRVARNEQITSNFHRYKAPESAAAVHTINAGMNADLMTIRQRLQEKIGSLGTFYITPGGSLNNSTYRGRLEATGEDHIVIRHQSTGQRELLPLAALDHAVFTESTSAYTAIAGQAAPMRTSLTGQ